MTTTAAEIGDTSSRTQYGHHDGSEADASRRDQKEPTNPSPTPEKPSATDTLTRSKAFRLARLISLLVVLFVGSCLAFVTNSLLISIVERHDAPVLFGPLSFSELRQINLPPPPPPPPLRVTPHFSVYFPTNSAVLPKSEHARLTRFARAFSGCDTGRVEVVGSASSTKFKGDKDGDDSSNSALAFDRAMGVVAELRIKNPSMNIQDPTISPVFRDFADARADPRREHPAEYLNRRVDIRLEYPSCKLANRGAVALT